MTRATAWLISCALAAGVGFAAGRAPPLHSAPAPAQVTAAKATPNWQQAWEQARGIANAEARATKLRTVAAQWVEQDPGGAAAAMQALPDAPERWALLPDLVERWARRAPRDATEWVLHLEASALRSESLLVALRELAAKDAPAAVAFAAQLPRREQRAQLPRVLVQWAERDLAATMEYLQRLEDAPLRDLTIVGIAADYAQRDVDAAITWASALPAEQSQRALRSVFWALASQDPPRASSMIAALADVDERRLAASEIAARWAGSDPTAALGWAFQEPVAAERTALIEVIFRRWSDYDAAAASRQLVELQDPLARDAAAIAVATNRFVPLALAEQARQMIADVGRKQKVASWLHHRLQGYGYDAALVERYRLEAGIAAEDPDAEIHNEFF